MGEKSLSDLTVVVLIIAGCVLLAFSLIMISAYSNVSGTLESYKSVICNVTTMTSKVERVMSNATGLETLSICLATENGTKHLVSDTWLESPDLCFAILDAQNKSLYVYSYLHLSNGTYSVQFSYGAHLLEYGSGSYFFFAKIEEVRQPTVLQEFILETKSIVAYAFDMLLCLGLCMTMLPPIVRLWS